MKLPSGENLFHRLAALAEREARRRQARRSKQSATALAKRNRDRAQARRKAAERRWRELAERSGQSAGGPTGGHGTGILRGIPSPAAWCSG
jgi:hypothetical protein